MKPATVFSVAHASLAAAAAVSGAGSALQVRDAVAESGVPDTVCGIICTALCGIFHGQAGRCQDLTCTCLTPP
ncbi:hypothetical protein CDD83_7457 [Cordyceps sp. RAO-2017]|nr:hypothetical protein CDD83_7457 [Cordyceps sp. RAO-2017]